MIPIIHLSNKYAPFPVKPGFKYVEDEKEFQVLRGFNLPFEYIHGKTYYVEAGYVALTAVYLDVFLCTDNSFFVSDGNPFKIYEYQYNYIIRNDVLYKTTKNKYVFENELTISDIFITNKEYRSTKEYQDLECINQIIR